MRCHAIDSYAEISSSMSISVGHLSYNKSVALAEEYEWESKQHVIKPAKLVVFAAVMESAGFETTWVLSLKSLQN